MDIAAVAKIEINNLKLKDAILLGKAIVALSSNEKEEKIKAIKDICRVLHVEKHADELFDEFEEKLLEKIEDNDDFKFLAGGAEKVFEDITATMKKSIDDLLDGKIEGKEFAEKILSTGLNSSKMLVKKNVSEGVEKAVGSWVDILKQGKAAKVGSMPWYAISYVCLSKAYENVEQARTEYTEAVEETALIESECEETIRLIAQYRWKLSYCVEHYLREHLETFERGLAAMDNAILEDDVYGFLSANSEIQKILKYDTQFETREEFDSLMESDDSFKL